MFLTTTPSNHSLERSPEEKTATTDRMTRDFPGEDNAGHLHQIHLRHAAIPTGPKLNFNSSDVCCPLGDLEQVVYMHSISQRTMQY